MSTELVGAIGIGILILLICCRFWVGAAFAIVGFVGIVVMRGFDTAMSIVVISPFTNIDTYVMTAIPMFTLMGMIIAETDIGKNLFDFSNKFLGRRPGGLAGATVATATLVCCVTGSDNVASVIMTKLAYPELKKRNYSDSLACASIAAPSIPTLRRSLNFGHAIRRLTGRKEVTSDVSAEESVSVRHGAPQGVGCARAPVSGRKRDHYGQQPRRRDVFRA